MNSDEDMAPVQVLLVEDNLGDVLLTREAIEEVGINYCLNVVHDGNDAMAFLRKQGAFADCPAPQLILLDLNLPRKPGHEVLREVQRDPRLQAIPLVVLTSSTHEQHVLDGCDPRRRLYITKPPAFAGLVRAMQEIETFRLAAEQE